MFFALVGNQNSGKTTLFNQLTGANQHVGNFPGVTVEQKSGPVRGRRDMTVVDLPGIYSLRPFSGDELVTREYLLGAKPDGLINIVDATSLERSLYLTLQLLDLRIPTVLALNMMDEMRGNGGEIDCQLLAEGLGVPVVPISAARGEGMEELADAAEEIVRSRREPTGAGVKEPALRRCLREVERLVEGRARFAGMSPSFAAAKLVENDVQMLELLKPNEDERAAVEQAVSRMESELGLERNEALARSRYQTIETLCDQAVKAGGESRERLRSLRMDRLFTHKYLGLPVFFAIMLAVFWLTFAVVGSWLSDLLGLGIERLTDAVDSALTGWGVNPVVHSLVVDGAFVGVGSVLSFLPIIVTLFFFLSILEDSGYMARVAFIMDRLLRGIGLSGRSLVPMLIGFGCTVPAVMAARTLPGERDRRLTILLLPFMSCSAKVPIYAVFTAAFFHRRQALAMTLLYLAGIGMGIVCGLLLKDAAFPGEPAPFVMELPNYRFPSPKSVLLLMWDRAKDFLQRAFTVIFLASMIIWFLQTFNYQFHVVEDSGVSLLATLGRAISPLFRPLGFGDWRISTALITGFTAKEAVVSTLAVLTGASAAELPQTLGGLFTPLTAASFLVFTLLYTPCVAAVATVSRELNSALSALGMVVMQCSVAWLAAAMVFHAGRLLGLG